MCAYIYAELWHDCSSLNMKRGLHWLRGKGAGSEMTALDTRIEHRSMTYRIVNVAFPIELLV